MFMELKSQGMDNNEYKLLIQQIRQEEEHNYGIELDIEGYSREDYVEIIFDNYYDVYHNLSDTKGELLFSLIRESPYIFGHMSSRGIAYCSKNKAYVSTGLESLKMGHLRNTAIMKNELASKLSTTYHEIRHLVQYYYNNMDTYDGFCNYVAKLYHNKYRTKYFVYHDNFFHEIDANRYGIMKTEEYLKRYPKLYEENKRYIEKFKNRYNFDLNNFDFDKFFSQLVKDNEYVDFFNVRFIDYINSEVIYKYIFSDYLDKKKLINSILSNKDYCMLMDMEHVKEGDLEIILEALKWKQEDLQDKMAFNNEYISNNKYNLVEKLKGILANKRLTKKMRDNEQLSLYVQKIKEEKNIFTDLEEVSNENDNNYISNSVK